MKRSFSQRLEEAHEKIDKIRLEESETLKGERVFLTVLILIPPDSVRLIINYKDKELFNEILSLAERQNIKRALHTPDLPSTIQ